MANTVQQSISKIRESFRTIRTTAEKAAVKFQEEGKPFIFARDYGINDESNYNATSFPQYVKESCDFFPNLAKRYSDEKVIDQLIVTPKSEAEEALCDHSLYELGKYCDVNSACFNIFENKETGGIINKSLDEAAIKTVNDKVRLLNTDAYKNYNNYLSRTEALSKRAYEYDLSREQKRQQISNAVLTDSEKQKRSDLKAKKESPYVPRRGLDFLNPINGFEAGLGIGGVICTILAVLVAIVLIVALITGEIPIDGYGADAPKAVRIILTILTLGIGFAIYGAIAYFAGMILVGVIFFIVLLAIDVIIALIKPFSWIVLGIVNSRERERSQAYYDSEIVRFNNYLSEKYHAEIEQKLVNWENEKREYEFLKNQNKSQLCDAYYREIARVAATSKPILTTILDDLNVIKNNIKIISTEYKNICKILGRGNINEHAIECYYLIVNGEVDTYQQAISMQRNLAQADSDREKRRREEARRKYEEEERMRQLKIQWEKERQEEERIKERERKEEERLKRLENAIRDAERAQREQTNAILHSAIATVKSINEQNERIEEQNKLLEKIERGY